MTTKTATKYNVGGVALDRPFKIRRLGHFGFQRVGFRGQQALSISICSAFLSPNPRAPVFSADMPAIITRSLCSTRKSSTSANTPATMPSISAPENDINQITWQIQSVSEMAEASKYFRGLGVEIMREGRAGGGGLSISSVRVGRRTSRSSNCVTVSSRSTGTAGPARSRCAMARRILPTNRSSRITNWCAPTSKKASVC